MAKTIAKLYREYGKIARASAQKRYQFDGDVRIENNAPIQKAFGGRSCWVQAWIWVPDADFEKVSE